MQEVKFDTVIFDEAGQVTLPLAIAGMLAGRKYVLIGDHQQMPPVIVAEHYPEWVAKSAFERMIPNVGSTMLDITYRMNGAINDFPSRTFYNGHLKTDAKNRHQKLRLQQQPTILSELLNPDVPSVFAVVRHTRCRVRSREEAIVIAMLVSEAIQCGVDAAEIAIVTPYRAQARLIINYLHRVLSDPAKVKQIVVDTVERMQGQEREVVIISLVTSDSTHAASRAEFYFMPNRLNVAITRSKVKRIVVGSPYLFLAQPKESQHQQWVTVFKNLYQSSPKVEVPAEAIIAFAQQKELKGL